MKFTITYKFGLNEVMIISLILTNLNKKFYHNMNLYVVIFIVKCCKYYTMLKYN